MDIEIVPLQPEDLRDVPTDFAFGRTFANRMFIQEYSTETGWQNPRIDKYQNLSLSPATAALHYAQEIFEGTKAYRREDGNINLFRPWENAKRFNHSAERMAMPTVDEEDHVSAIAERVEIEQEWVPSEPGSALYIRPTMIATDPFLGLASSQTFLHYVIIGPVGSYFKEGFKPVAVWISEKHRRAVRGGVGSAKTGGNYAASIFVTENAKKNGYSQVLWLDAINGKYVEEVGAMNICFVYDGDTIVTPPLSDSILAGVTRDSVLRLGRDLGYTVKEELIDAREMLKEIENGRVTEAFGCGTAAVITPVGKFGFQDKEYVVNDNQPGPVAEKMFKTLTDIQYGRVPDPYGWTLTIETS